MVIHLSAFPIACGPQTGWNLSQDGRDIQVIVCDTDVARGCADLCAHRASLLGVLAARPENDRATELAHLGPMFPMWPGPLALRGHLTDLPLLHILRRQLAAHGREVAITIELMPPLDCAHWFTVTVQPHVGQRFGRLAQICKCCGSFRRRIGCTWGPWELSAPDVNDGQPWPDGAEFMIQEDS